VNATPFVAPEEEITVITTEPDPPGAVACKSESESIL
jgi:hypothetical protein